jgi:hypothetical protein
MSPQDPDDPAAAPKPRKPALILPEGVQPGRNSIPPGKGHSAPQSPRDFKGGHSRSATAGRKSAARKG